MSLLGGENIRLLQKLFKADDDGSSSEDEPTAQDVPQLGKMFHYPMSHNVLITILDHFPYRSRRYWRTGGTEAEIKKTSHRSGRARETLFLCAARTRHPTKPGTKHARAMGGTAIAPGPGTVRFAQATGLSDLLPPDGRHRGHLSADELQNARHGQL